MTLDIPTLMLADAFVCAFCACILMFAWWQSHERAALWWAASLLAQAFAVAQMALGYVLFPALFTSGLVLLIAAPVLLWCGIRAFFESPLRPLPIAAGLALWPASLGMPELNAPTWAPIAVHTLLIAGFNGAAARELLRHRGERLRARLPLVALLLVNAGVFLLAIPSAISGELQDGTPPPLASLFGIVHLETLVFAIGVTVLLVMLIKERGEEQARHEARTDALTGLANRRAFLDLSERVAARCRRAGESFAVVVFDLDRFKAVNDTCGHAIGDEVLRVFARTARETLRPGDIISRVGGEEFFAVLPGADTEDGRVSAERVRHAFAEASAAIEGLTVPATVSAGVTSTSDPEQTIAALVEKADEALYRAKLNGRNRVQSNQGGAAERRAPQLVRVA